MTVRIEMPQLSSEGESAALASWLIKAGDAVEAGEVIAELETDKSTVELEAPAAGTIGEIHVAAGTEDVAPGTLLATLEGDSQAASTDTSEPPVEVPSATGQARVPDPPAPITTTPPTTTSPISAKSTETSTPTPTPVIRELDGPEQGADDPLHSTPLARRAAANQGLDLSAIEGSGPGGRILEADVLKGADRKESKPATEQPAIAVEALDFSSVRMSAMRKTIARRMTESKQQVPHFYLSARCSMDEVMEFRARLNSELADVGREVKLSVNDFVVKAAALALREVPAANVRFAGDEIHVFDRIDLAIAVATEGGLLTPVVRHADRKGLTLLAEEIKELAERARAGSLRPDEYQDGTMTISNLGMYGIESVYPILNPPQACILGVGAAEEQPVVRSGELGIGRVASLTLAADHRVVDGAVGARLLAAIRARLEDPLSMML